MDKVKEYKDYAMDKVKAAADTAMDMKDSGGARATRAMTMFTGGKIGDIDHKALQGGDMEEKYGETEFKAREKMQERKLNEEGVYDETKQRAAADNETAAERGIAARKNIYGAIGSVRESIREKLTYPTDIVQEARASREYGGPKRATREKLVDDVEEGPYGPSAFPCASTAFTKTD